MIAAWMLTSTALALLLSAAAVVAAACDTPAPQRVVAAVAAR